MATKVTASLTVNFSADSTASTGGLVLEVDDRADGLNNGVTTFRPGDPVYYLLYQQDDISIVQHIVTAGGYSQAGSGLRSVDEYLTFSGSREASLKYPAASAVTKTWVGRSPGEPAMVNSQTVLLPAEGVGILRVQYQAAYQAFRLQGVPVSINQVMIYIQGERA